MKNYTFLAIILFITGLSFSSAQKLKSDVVENKSFDLEPFTSITVSEDIEVELEESFSHRAEASSNFMEYLRLVVDESGNLFIDFNEPAKAKFKKNKTTVKVWAVNVQKFQAQSGAELNVKARFKDDEQWILASSKGIVKYDADCEKLNIEVSSASLCEGKISAGELNANATSKGEIKLKGDVKTANLMASSKGNIDANRLNADNVQAKADSKGNISIGVNHELIGEVTSGAKINYKANSAITLDIDQKSGGGVKEIKGIF